MRLKPTRSLRPDGLAWTRVASYKEVLLRPAVCRDIVVHPLSDLVVAERAAIQMELFADRSDALSASSHDLSVKAGVAWPDHELPCAGVGPAGRVEEDTSVFQH